MRKNFKVVTYKLLVGIIFMLLLTSYGSYRMIRRLHEKYVNEYREEKVIDNLERFLSNLKDVEIGQRGYLFAYGEEYLQLYRTSKKQTQNLLAQLQVLLAGAPNANKYITQLEKLTTEYIANFDNEIRLQANNKTKEMSNSLQRNSGKKSMDRIRLLVGRMQNEQKAMLQQHYQQLDREMYFAFIISWAGIALSLIGGFLLMIYRDRYISELKEKASFLRDEKMYTEKALESIEEKYERLFSEDITGNFICTAEGKILFCNPAFAQMLGFDSVEEALKHSAVTFLFNSENWHEMISLLKKEKKLENYELKLKRADGRPVFVIQNLIGDFDESGALKTMKGYLFDITEHKKLEDQFRQSQKLESIGQLAGGIAHDFNNLLTVINGYSDLLLSDLGRDDPRWGDIDEIRKAGKRAAELTRQILAFSRRQVLDVHVLDLNYIVNNLSKMIQRLLRENIKLITVLDENLGSVKVDPGQMEQVLINLTINARDAMPKGGVLTIETQNVILDREYARHHFAVEPGEYIMLAVSDTGKGMTKEVKDRIFEPFFTTKEKGRGTGLGLSTVYGIVKQSGGNIEVYSEPGKGTSFKVYLPRTDEAPESFLKSGDKELSSRGTETILLVEDDEDVQTMMIKTLKRFGYTVLIAKDGEEGLEKFRRFQEIVSFVITDVVMPGKSGRTLANNIKKMKPNTEILYISGYTDNAIVHQGILEPGTHFMQKPFTPDQLAKKVRMILDAK